MRNKCMEAPDKIYIYTANVGDNHYSISSTDNPVDKKYEVEYIRKDAILELLQNRNKEINGTSKAFFRSQELQEIYWRISEL